MSKELRKVSLAEIDRPKVIDRLGIDADKVRELAESIRAEGLENPIKVRPVNGRYEIVWGDRRFLAHKLLGWNQIDCWVEEMGDEDIILKRAIENLQREDLSPVERGLIFKRMNEKAGMTKEDIARKLGLNRMTVLRLLKLVEADDEITKGVHEGKIGIGAGLMLSEIEDKDIRHYYVTNAVENGATQEVIKIWVEDYEASKAALYYDENRKGGGQIEMELDDKPHYTTCGVCLKPALLDKVRSLTVCPKCTKGIIERRIKGDD